MNAMNIHIPELRADLARLRNELLPLKRSLRRPWPGPMVSVQQRSHGLAAQITARLILLAWSRGRRHLSTAPRWLRDAGLADNLEEYQARVAARLAEQYPRPPGVGPASPPAEARL